MERIALTAKYPYAGCTKLGSLLQQDYYYNHISMSDTLIAMFCDFCHDVSRGDVIPTPLYIKQNKEKYRSILHSFAVDYEEEYIHVLKTQIHLRGSSSIIIEKVRTDKQADMLIELGFKVIRINRPEHEVMNVARRHGHNVETFQALMQSGSEGHVSDSKIFDTLTNSFTCDILARYLVSSEVHGDVRL